MRTRARDTFATITTEGAILPPDLLDRIAAGDGDLGGLDPASYHLAGEEINEAISRSWNRLVGVWAAFRERREQLPESQAGTAGLTRERWLLPLFDALGYGRLQTQKAVAFEGKSYPVSHRWQNVPIHLVGFRTGLDERTRGVAGAARTSPHGLLQEFLNRSDDHLWAFLSNGLSLRILRDNASLTRQAYVEFDLEAMMDGEVYPDFVLLWLLCHQSRVEASEARPEECWLEKWSHAAAERGTRVREKLRDGVEEAIASLGAGFLSHRANERLRRRLYSGELSAQDYYRQLLRLVYRLLFLFVAEDRDLLLHPDAGAAARDRYTNYYSTRKLRRLAEKRTGGRHPDLYRQLSLVMGKLGEDEGCPELGLPALGGFLFSDEAMPDLEAAEISNRDLLDAVRALSFVESDGVYRPVDYKNLGSEELGSVYESLLELHPVLDASSTGATGTFALEAAGGSERRTTGSFYTPAVLRNSLLDTALEPVLDEAAKGADPERAILDLKVCDPACGSGNFLVAAAHRIARRLAAVRTGDEEPSPARYREALREVIGRCVYGVDVNPMAVELCKVSLWMEAVGRGRPLSFLDNRIRVGNSLLGATEELINGGIPDDAFKPIVADDRQLANALKRRNRDEIRAQESGQISFSLHTLDREREAVEIAHAAVERTGDRSVAEVREKAARYAALEGSEEMLHRRRVADAWCAAFVWPKREGAPEPIAQEIFADLSRDAHALPRATEEESERITERYGFFHWHLAFPGVFGEDGSGEPGFDVVLGNPPWERIKLQEQEWFASRRPDIARAANAAARRRMIEALKTEDPALHAAYLEDLRKADGESHFIRSSGRFPLCGRGDVNTYSVFAETDRQIVSPTGRVGCIVPSGIATDNTTKEFFGDLVDTRTLASLYDFENRRGIFPNVHRSYKFSLLTTTGRNRPVEEAEFAFFALDVADLKDPERRFPLTAEDIRLLNPNTRTCPIFRTRRDAEITKSIYRRVPVLIDENRKDGNPWGVTFLRMFDMSNDSGLFRTREELETDGWELAEPGNVFHKSGKRYLPLYEAKMLHHYDHRWATYTPSGATRDLILSEKQDLATAAMPRYWVPEREVNERKGNRWPRKWLMGWRDICRSTDERTAIAGIVPLAGTGDTLLLKFPQHRHDFLLPSCLDSFACDFATRQKIGGTHLKYHYFKQLPVLPPDAYDGAAPWDGSATLRDWIFPRVLELTYTAYDLAPFARDLGYEGPPFRWDPERRFLLRCELDAAFFHLYRLGRDDAGYIMETFPIVKRKDETAHGEYRTKRVILEIYDQMARAASGATGQPYRTPLDPPPVDLKGDRPATVTPLRPRKERPEPRPGKAPPAAIAAEERRRYEPRTRTDAPTDTHPQGEDSPDLVPERQEDNAAHAARPAGKDQTKPAGDLTGEIATQSPAPQAPNPNEATLTLHACLPDGEKVERDALLADAARELGHPKLTKKVRRALNKALNTEHNAGRLKTDWKLVWKSKKR